MGQSNLEIAITALNDATSTLQETTANLKDLKGGAEEAGKATEGTNKNLGDLVEGLTGFNIATLASVGSVLAIVEGLKAAVEETMSYEDSVRKVSNLTGTTADESSRLISVFGRFGIETGQLTTLMRGLSRQGIELNVESLKALSVEFNALPDQAAKNAFALQMFGRSGLDVEAMLKQGPDAIQGYIDSTNSMMVVNQAQLDQEFKLKQDLFDLKEQYKGLSITIGTALIPILDKAVTNINIFTGAVDANTKKVALDEAATSRNWGAYQNYINELRKDAPVQDATAEGLMKYEGAITNAHKAMEINTGSIETNKEKLAAQKDQLAINTTEMGIITTSFGTLTAAMLYNEASAGLDKDAALALAKGMGLVNTDTYDALTQVSNLNKELADKKITLDEYSKAVQKIYEAEERLHDKSISITVHYGSTGSVTVTGGTDSGDTGGSRAGLGGQVGGGGVDPVKRSKPGSQYAIGGWGGGRAVVGENGTEMVDLPTGSHVINNYDMRTSYNLSAHYPSYQDPHGAKNDLIGMTMLRNAGASRWVS